MGARGKILVPLILLAGLAGAATFAHASAAAAASVSHGEGSVVVAPAGATEWSKASPGRAVNGGDRLWTDPGARAEVHLGGAVLHMDSEAFVEVADLGAGLFLGHLHEGALLVRVRALAAGDQLEVGTPHFSVRLLRAGDYRIDVDPARGTSRLTVRQGHAFVRGSKGQAVAVPASQQLEWAAGELRLAPAAGAGPDGPDAFERWAANRHRREEQVLASRARPAPRQSAPDPQAAGEWVWIGSRWAWMPAPAPVAPPAVRGWEEPRARLLPPGRISRGEAEDPRTQWQLDQAQRQMQPQPPRAWLPGR